MEEYYRVVKVIDDYTVVINAGISDVEENETFNLYGSDNEHTFDPLSGEDLGVLLYPKGKGIIIDVQDKMSILKSCEFETTKRREKPEVGPYDMLRNPLAFSSPKTVEYDHKIRKMFDNPQIGDIVK